MMSLLIILLAITSQVMAGPLQTYSYNYEDFIIFNDVEHNNNVMYIELSGALDILFLENMTDPSLYRIEINEGEPSCIFVSIYNDAEGGKITGYDRKHCEINEKKILKVNWDSTKVTIHLNDKTLFHFSNEIKFPKVHHISI